ncbi:MAG: AcrR family transcriptional regulator [Alteromonadaceae bacterium]|jgi:AcrR family transcriptional regulator|tara:strand:+ start:819 stop:1430 length:612 start_codon:yes stop_codon:yes gene_type:complete
MINIPTKAKYHHGDLRTTLLEVAAIMLTESGIEEVSLRKLAARVGVSRSAPYHHFKDKNALLCGIAEKGFKQLYLMNKNSFDFEGRSTKEKFSRYIHQYVKFAKNNPELYELMFGRAIWKQENSTQELRDTAYPCFQYQVEMTKEWQDLKLLNHSEEDNALRASQVLWGTVHGIAKLLIDGIYTDVTQVEEICDCAIDMFLAH